MGSMRYFAVFGLLLMLFSPVAFAAEEHLLPLQGTAKLNGVRLSGGNLIVEIYDNMTGGNLVYNSTNDFLNVISDGAYDILLGNGTQPLSLNYGTKYYMDMYINSVDVDFNNSERQVFMSTVGNLTVTTPIRTNSTDVDDALNVSAGGAFFGGNLSVNQLFNVSAESGGISTADGLNVSGQVRITSSDTDDALNVSNGGGNFKGTLGVRNFSSGQAFTINGGFNISASTGGLLTNSSIRIDTSRAFAFSVNQGFNITGADNAVRTNSTVTIVSLSSPALSINGFNVSGSNAALSTNGTVTIGSTAIIQSTDADDALNVSNGGGNFRGQVSIQNYTSAPAFTVNYGFNVSGANAAVSTNGTVSILSLASPALSINGFNVSGSNGALSTNGTVTIAGVTTLTNTDADDTLNVSNGGGNFRGQLGVQNYTAAGPAFTVNYGFNISGASSALNTNGTMTILSLVTPALSINGFNVSGANAALSTNGTVTMGSTAVIQSTDADDALNVSNGGGNFRGQLGVQNYTSAPAFTVNYGFNVSGANGVLSTNSTIGIETSRTNAFSVNRAFNITGANNDVLTNATITIQGLASPALSINGFNVSGSNAALSTNGTVLISSADTDDALNVTNGVFIGGNTVFNNFFNITGSSGNLRTSGTIFSLSTDGDDALNITGGARIGGTPQYADAFTVDSNGATTIRTPDGDDALNLTRGGATFLGSRVTVSFADTDDALNITNGSITIGKNQSASQLGIFINSGGTDQCGFIALADVNGTFHYLFMNTTGVLRMMNSTPSGVGNCERGGTPVGLQT